MELPRPGRFDVEAADALGVPPGPERGALQRGEPVDARRAAPSSGPSRCSGRRGPAASWCSRATRRRRGPWSRRRRGADLLVHEATFCADERERAEETRHSTAAEAAQVALAGAVKMLALTHVSTRYFGPEVLREARELFANTVVPKDFDIIELPFQERGEPRLIKGGALPGGGSEAEQQPAVPGAASEERAE